MKPAAIQTLDDWARIFTRVEVWLPVVRAIFHREGLPCSSMAAGYPGSHAAFVVDERYVVKIACPFWQHDLHREVAVYHKLRQIDTPVPDLLAYGHYDGWLYLILSYCSGTALRELNASLTVKQKQVVAEQLAEILRQVHTVQLSESEAEWSAVSGKLRKQAISRLEQAEFLPSAVRKAAVEFVSGWDYGEQMSRIKLLHADLTADHLLLDSNGSKITAIIDWADSLNGPMEYELVALWFGAFHRDSRVFRAFLKAYDPCMPVDRRKLLAYTLIHRFGLDIVQEVLAQSNKEVSSLAELSDLLWPIPYESRL